MKSRAKKPTASRTPLGADELRRIDAWWRACNYLSVGMLYLAANPLLREPLRPEHIKRRLLGHWGSDPGQSFVIVHLNRLIRKYDLDVLYISGPGHGAPAVLANAYLEATYSEVYPDRSQDEEGLQKFFKLFSFPGGIGSHCTPETPGSIHEGGELGYSLSHAFGAVFDNPQLIAVPVVGDGEAETGPLATAWHSNKFLNPARDGAVLPILHLNGYKIANPTILARIPAAELESLMVGYGYHPHVVEGDDPRAMHQRMAATLERCVLEIRELQAATRRKAASAAGRPRWPMIILRSPKGWTAPKEVDGHQIEGSWRAHQVPITRRWRSDSRRFAARARVRARATPRAVVPACRTAPPADNCASISRESSGAGDSTQRRFGSQAAQDARLPALRVRGLQAGGGANFEYRRAGRISTRRDP